MKMCDTKLERDWLQFLESHNLALPSEAQRLFSECQTRPDFYYGDSKAAVYIDGPPHDFPDRQERDKAQTDLMQNYGYTVVRFHHAADWHKVVDEYPSIFGSATTLRDVLRVDFAIFTLKFAKPDDAAFSETDQQACVHEGKLALTELLNGLLGSADAKVEVMHIGEGEGTFWVDFAVALIAVNTFFSGPANTLHALGLALEAWGAAYDPPILALQRTGKWLQGVAWRLTPQPFTASHQSERRPGCFGVKKWLDRRTGRCKPCGFLSDCVNIVEGTP
jgi:very-short-patch-repair endonuclease